MNFGEWLRTIRLSREPAVSQESLAVGAASLDQEAPKEERAQFSQARVSEWERGDRLPSLRQFACICLALEATRDERKAGKKLWEAAQLQGIPVDGRELFDEDSRDVVTPEVG